jgi:pimeloyl-ACP methyl ester carboxylesterase
VELDGRRIDTGTTTLDVYDSGGPGGPGSAEAVVFLHGNLSRWRHWAPQLEALRGELRCVALDQRGFGGSDLDPPPTSLVAMAQDVADVCGALGVSRAHVVGLSLGGVVAQAVAVHHPALTASLALASTYRLDEPHPVVAELNAGAVPGTRLPPLAGMAGPAAAMSFGPGFRERRPDVVDRVVGELVATAQASFEATMSLLAEGPLVTAPAIAAPTLVIGATQDATAPPEVTRHLADAIPGARYELIDAGHVSNLEQPERFTAFVREHVAAAGAS